VSRAGDPFDTYLLRVLCTVLSERSVSRTAIKLNQSQPAISVALKRLRTIFHDPLLVREKGGMVPTERALEIYAAARVALEEIDKLFVEGDKFSPATTQQAFKVGCPDYIVVSFLSGMVETLRKSAPHARLTLHALGPEYDYERALAEGGLDIVIGNWPDPPGQLHLSPLLDDELVCVMAEANPLARKPMTVAQYLAAPHVVPMPYSPSHRGVVDTHLAAMRVAQRARRAAFLLDGAPPPAGHGSPVHDDAAFRGALRQIPAARHRARAGAVSADALLSALARPHAPFRRTSLVSRPAHRDRRAAVEAQRREKLKSPKCRTR